ncbi:MAG: hypothetical protein WEB87_05015, partial [Bacteriovoracaceae bacterium]
MGSQSLLDQDRFWDIIQYLIQLDKEKEYDEICSDLSLSKSQLNSFILFLKEVDCDLACHSKEGHSKEGHSEKERRYAAPANPSKITLEFTLLEWLQFQACFPKISENEGKPFYEKLKSALLAAEHQYQNHDLFEPAKKLETVMSLQTPQVVGSDQAMQSELAAFIEEAILDKSALKISLKEGQKISVFPRKVVFLDGALSLVGEEVQDNCLINVGINEIQSATEEEKIWKKLFSQMEVEDFICSLRAVAEKEVRLVLKVYSRESFNSNLKHQHFANQCMFTNPQGDFIWAAS